MAKGYWIIGAEVSNPDQFAVYRDLSTAAVQAHGGRFLARGGQAEIVEGEARSRQVVIEFDSYATAMTAYNSEAYKKARDARKDAADFNVVIVEGV